MVYPIASIAWRADRVDKLCTNTHEEADYVSASCRVSDTGALVYFLIVDVTVRFAATIPVSRF